MTALAHRNQRLDLSPQLVTDLESRRHLHDLQSLGHNPRIQGPQPNPLILKDLLSRVGQGARSLAFNLD